MENLRVALVQMQSVVGETEKNITKIKELVMDANGKNVDIICFPELAVQGYTRERANELAEDIPGPSSNYLVNLAREKRITILAGIIEKSLSNKPYISQLICLPDGSFYKYRKSHLGESEAPYFSAGNDLPVFKSPKANFAIQICWDLHFPEVSTIYSLKGAEVIFAPHASPTIVGDRKEIWLRYLTARAYDNSIFIASCNLIGENGIGSNFCGGCLVIDPKGQVIGEDFSNKESLLVVDLPKDQINKIRYEKRKSMRSSFYLEYRRPELYGFITKEQNHPRKD
ncbi:MAG: beta-ureidopropionase [Clostridia bacterium]|jgi:predicted amidohydrolase|nr:beta-ureidopropionase [Clostridia bacterium]MDN5321933.1 beta-ureidopropionase [Clostridia bacterium]